MVQEETIATPYINVSELMDALKINFNALKNISDAHQQRLYSENYNTAEDYKRKMLVDELEIQALTEGQQTRATKLRRILHSLPLSLLTRGHLKKIELLGTVNPNAEYPKSFTIGDLVETSVFHECVMVFYSFPRAKIKGNIRELWEKYTVYLMTGAIFYGAAYHSDERITNGKIHDYTLSMHQGTRKISGREFAEELLSIIRGHDDIYTPMKKQYDHLGDSAHYYIVAEVIAAYFMGFVMSSDFHFNPLPKALKIRIHLFIHSWLELPSALSQA